MRSLRNGNLVDRFFHLRAHAGLRRDRRRASNAAAPRASQAGEAPVSPVRATRQPQPTGRFAWRPAVASQEASFAFLVASVAASRLMPESAPASWRGPPSALTPPSEPASGTGVQMPPAHSSRWKMKRSQVVAERCADDGRIAAHAHRPHAPPVVAGIASARGELGLLGPRSCRSARRCRRHLARAGTPLAPTMAVPPLIDTEEPNKSHVRVAHRELGLLGPRGAALHEDVRGTCSALPSPVVRGADDGRTAAHGHRGAADAGELWPAGSRWCRPARRRTRSTA